MTKHVSLFDNKCSNQGTLHQNASKIKYNGQTSTINKHCNIIHISLLYMANLDPPAPNRKHNEGGGDMGVSTPAGVFRVQC